MSQTAPAMDGAIRAAARWLAAIVGVALLGGCISTPVASKSPESVPTPQWTSFHESSWGYSIDIPIGWVQITRGERLPRQERDFSNETVTDAGTLAGLDGSGFFFRITINRLTAACPELPADGVVNFEVLIDGYPATALLRDDEQEFSTLVDAVKVDATTDKYCYTFTGLARSTQVRDEFLPTVIHMLSSFKFGTPVSPPF